MKLNRVIILQPYLFWKGHYKKYFENLITKKNTHIYCAQNTNNYPNSIFLKASIFNTERSFIWFILTRIINSFKVIWKLITISYKYPNDKLILHFIELEPLSFLFFELFNSNKDTSIIITIHSIERVAFKNVVKNFSSLLQRFVYKIALKRSAVKGYFLVVHYYTHMQQLLKVTGEYDKILVNEYPAPELRRSTPKEFTNQIRLLIYGQIREDKGIFEFLSKHKIQKFKITIAGRVHDARILTLRKIKNYTFLDRFITDEELDRIMNCHDFLILPYKSEYSGGAGPLKDAFAYGMPVICSDIPIFREVLHGPTKGVIYKSEMDITQFLDSITSAHYINMSSNCLQYAKEISWHHMREMYFDLYEKLK